MKIKPYDDTEETSISYDDFMAEMEAENTKKNLRNWIDHKFPKGFCGWRATHSLTHPWLIFQYCYRETKYAFQRVFRGWDDRVPWNIYAYLSDMLPIWLKILKENKQGIPASVFEGLPYEDENTCSYSDESWEIANKRWESILDGIILGFETVRDDDWLVEKGSKEKFNKGMKLFSKHFLSLWD
jgi:hypothetical protein